MSLLNSIFNRRIGTSVVGTVPNYANIGAAVANAEAKIQKDLDDTLTSKILTLRQAGAGVMQALDTSDNEALALMARNQKERAKVMRTLSYLEFEKDPVPLSKVVGLHDHIWPEDDRKLLKLKPELLEVPADWAPPVAPTPLNVTMPTSTTA